MKILRNRCKIYIFIYLIIAVFYLWMAAQVPYTHDDWIWGSAVGMEEFLHATANSRYVGNFFEVVMTRSEFLKVAFMGVSYFLIPFLLMRIAAKDQEIMEPDRQLLLFLLCNCLILTMNRVMWREVYGWTAGFANFGISALFLLLWLKELLKAFDSELEDKRDSPGKVILYLAASFCGQLFIENLAIYCVLLACVLCGIYYYRFRKVPCRVLAMGIGAVGGLIVMFSSNIYQSLFTTGHAVGGVRSILIVGVESFSYAVSKFAVQAGGLFVRLYFNNFALSMLVLAAFSCVLRRKKEKITIRFYTRFKFFNYMLLIVFAAWFFYEQQTPEDLIVTNYLQWVLSNICQFMLSGIYFCVITMEVFCCFEGKTREKLLALWLSSPLLIAPLLVTTEMGQRLFFTTNIAVLLFVVLIISDLMEATTALTLKRAGFLAAFIAVFLFGFYGQMYSDIGACKDTRENLINEALMMGQKVIKQPSFPHDEYLHGEDPAEGWRVPSYKEFYGIPADVELIFESLNQ